jgi:hypothetical protein
MIVQINNDFFIICDIVFKELQDYRIYASEELMYCSMEEQSYHLFSLVCTTYTLIHISEIEAQKLL